MKKKTDVKKILIGLVVLIVVAAVMLVAYTRLKPKTTEGSKKIVVEVVIPEKENKEYTIKTDAEYLGQALNEIDIVKGTQGDYGLLITEVAGRVIDESKQEWWCITKGGEDVFTGADMTPIADGEHYELTLTVGYDFE